MSNTSIKIGYQGEKGAYSEKALDVLYEGQEIEKVPFRTSYEVVEALKKNMIDFGLLPIENSIVGNIIHTYDLLLENKLSIVREIVIPIHHALIAHPESTIKDIKQIYSHPAAISQCEVFLRKFGNCDVYPTYDTAGSVKMIAEQRLLDTAAIASAESAKIYGLKILQDKIEDYPHNQTRFVLLSAEPLQMEQEEYMPCKTTMVFDTLDQPGMLYQCLGVFEKYKVNMTQLSSRPHKTEPWKYHFFVDIDGHANDEAVASALEEIRNLTGFLYVCGSYPKFEASEFEPGKRKKGKKKVSGPLYSREYKAEPTIIEIGGLQIGEGNFIMIAGPCSVEGRHQMIETAKIVHEHGAHLLRGGAFKPRTSPYSFQGLGEEGLKLLKEAGEMFNMPTVSEVLSVETVELMAQYVDILQIGARNMQNFVLLREVGKLNKPILLKRGMMATVKEFLLSAEYILAQGNPNVILCERGIRTFETATRNTLDISAIPLLKELTHLPVIVDPSHASGVSKLVEPLSLAAAAAGADGLMVEVHFNPSTALSDGPQALDERQFKHLMKSLEPYCKK
ncbi:phospho-2-dehydro-3-deoxyheptonate aldolase [Caldithrix abyssi DSM 13497]|uniref:3-deoxy-D-arabinoheptulosonate-7-phosphate synthase n=1 Tax=Caldithrix abyssi DSM 13497 TaxID=880073 RepID=H1XSJ1_CALAY|nr:3-deoxy-7-phosphoheptulonate synthase [Caldithrix abyssi]APF18547.1 3-deoxy-D-arabinoheptulosonate-7-phosphate synthase [Caldithrix abyssi DSM 13497]EHO42539.1 phospho-2-dehydro-3-deoxyheptonate aldolase [Caldithrix abyssi DSM 13497]